MKKSMVISLIIFIGLILAFTLFFFFNKEPLCGTPFVCDDGTVLAGCDESVLSNCPNLEFCDAVDSCSKEGYDCYKFESNNQPYCYYDFLSDPCSKCDSKKCSIAESYPIEVFCQ